MSMMRSHFVLPSLIAAGGDRIDYLVVFVPEKVVCKMGESNIRLYFHLLFLCVQ